MQCVSAKFSSNRLLSGGFFVNRLNFLVVSHVECVKTYEPLNNFESDFGRYHGWYTATTGGTQLPSVVHSYHLWYAATTGGKLLPPVVSCYHPRRTWNLNTLVNVERHNYNIIISFGLQPLLSLTLSTPIIH